MLTPFDFGELSLNQLRMCWSDDVIPDVTDAHYSAVDRGHQTVLDVIARDQTVYGINTGFGLLAQTRISDQELQTLQRNLVLSHCTGVGDPLDPQTVRLIIVLKINSLLQGHSGITRGTVDALLNLLRHDAMPRIPARGSVGASGDLAPLAHLAAALLGVGEIHHDGSYRPARDVLDSVGQAPIELHAKEGLALLNGTQVSTGMAMAAFFRAEQVLASSIVAGAISLDALKGSDTPFDERIHQLRRQPGQIVVARKLRQLQQGSDIRNSHLDCDRVQDPYCLRCMPQVIGACLDLLYDVAIKLTREANAVTDNPLVFSDNGDILSGGNFHAEPVAFAADMLAMMLAEIGNMSERRTAMLVDPHTSQLPAFLVENSGLNSGFMIAQVTAAALASENKQLSHPASTDSIPTSANQEDHVSMAAHAAHRLWQMSENAATIIGIEALAAVQGLEFHRPITSSQSIEAVVTEIRRTVPAYDEDRFFAPDLVQGTAWVFGDQAYAMLADCLPSQSQGSE